MEIERYEPGRSPGRLIVQLREHYDDAEQRPPVRLRGSSPSSLRNPRWRDFGWTALLVVAGRSGKSDTGCSSMFRAGQIDRRWSSSVILMPWQSLLSMHTTI
jgi:hypothetical protein